MPQQMEERPVTFTPPSTADVMRYRYHYGVNLGSLFVLERWLCPWMVPFNTGGHSELSAVQGWIKLEGEEITRQRLEWHWDNYISDADLDWIRDVGKCNTVRLPIGYWILPRTLSHTPFEPVSWLYVNAWQAVWNLLKRCRDRGIGVLIDLHAVQGGANFAPHSGTDSEQAKLWKVRTHQSSWSLVLQSLLNRVKGMDGVIGVQIVNEAQHGLLTMYMLYDTVLAKLAAIDPTMPVYVSDAWDLTRTLLWCQDKNSIHAPWGNPVVVDTHYYRCMSAEDGVKTQQEILNEVPRALDALDGNHGFVVQRTTAQVVVGEYCCVLGTNSKISDPRRIKTFGRAQCETFQQKAGGQFFWTYKGHGEWSFREMTEKGNLSPPYHLTLTPAQVKMWLAHARAQRACRKRLAVVEHVLFWHNIIKDKKYSGQYNQG